eukprot:CAMPEP_0194321386 /NCGR_PEP_ID=MMETSP0171-20130528/17607_1 /TAXON_ID=218684 /ORGANISM="Corethron pennatum, Strain L29A3" /LENGTH=1219 /DNA_ID=CAMNT_0039079259 /DNA_START=51 /DNA_END=3710 /DNA_ORIENTATION=+
MDYPLSDDDDGPECRVCRGPAEEGRPLYSPCRCTGSIGLVHQSCLESWLDMNPRNRSRPAPAHVEPGADAPPPVPRSAPRCELCSYPFSWDPLYSEDAPDVLPAIQVLYYGVVRRGVLRHLPILFRAAAAFFFWCVLLPLATGWLYVGWMHWPSSVIGRVVVSAPSAGTVETAATAAENATKWTFRADHLWDDVVSGAIVSAVIVVSFLSLMSFVDFLRVHFHQAEFAANAAPAAEPAEEGEDEIPDPVLRRLAGEVRAAAVELPRQHRGADGELRPGAPPDLPPPLPPPLPLFDLDEADADLDGVEIHLALDELLGLRGPIGAMLRNVAWVVLINTTYLGLFVFIPHEVGSACWPLLRNSVTEGRLGRFLAAAANATGTAGPVGNFAAALMAAWGEYEQNAAGHDSILQLADVLAILAGYASMGAGVFAARTVLGGAAAWRKSRTAGDAEEGGGFWWAFWKISGAVECFAAIFKVATLLFLKMLLLPLLLGTWLDVCTLPLFGHVLGDRLAFAGANLFGALLLHWVVGITFMLLVTVSVLQLREVVHPDLLAQVIRPQEPQPDLLGNLLQERVSTHAKRMMLSLGIYVALLCVFVWAPAMLVHGAGLSHALPFLRLRFRYVLPHQLQVPVELFVFHLCMLAFLEKYKNHIGEMQHYWLVYLCGKLGIIESVLPLDIRGFELVAKKALFLKKGFSDGDDGNDDKMTIDPFWHDFSQSTDICLIDDYLLNKEQRDRDDSRPFQVGKTITGFRVLDTTSTPFSVFLRPPLNMESESVPSLPCYVGPYRLRFMSTVDNTDQFPASNSCIEIWREVPGRPIMRPPAGWDDLMGGGAEAQGRWAWGKEPRSEVERSAAHRSRFKRRNGHSLPALVWRMAILAFLWWTVHLAAMGLSLGAPLVVGRHVLEAVRVPEDWIHDPLAFPLGLAILFPFVSGMHRLLLDRWEAGGSLAEDILAWAWSYRRPSGKKGQAVISFLALWVCVAPLCCGMLFSLFFAKKWEELAALPHVWKTGSVLLSVWVYSCYVGLITEEFWNNLRGELPPVGAPAEENINAEEDEPPPPAGRLPELNGIGATSSINEVPPTISQRWQGPNGAVARAANCLWDVLSSWEWDKVDPEVLLDGCAYPVAKNLCVAAAGSAALCAFVEVLRILLVNRPGPLETDLSGHRLILLRVTVLVVILFQISVASRDRFRKWFRMVHKAARDERYLVGKTLRNLGQTTAL